MGRSTNPNNYSSFFWELLSLMEGDKEKIEFDLPAGQASSLRRQFYAFIKALEISAKRDGRPEVFVRSTSQANTLRGYLVRIEINGKPIHYTKYTDKRPAKLIFVNRDLDPFMSDVMEQLHEQTSANVALTDSVQQKSVDSFFDTPLEVADVHSTPEEPAE